MKPIFRIISFTRRFALWYIGMGLFVLSVSALSLVGPFLSKSIVDLIVAKLTGHPGNISMFLVFLGGIIATDIAITLFTALGQWAGDLLTIRLQTFLSKAFYEHVLSLHIGYFDNEITGQIVNKMYRGITSITEFMQNMLNNFLPFFFTAFITIVVLSFYSPVISILLFILFPAYILISHGSSKAWMGIEDRKNTLVDQSQGRVFESFVGIRVVKSFAAELGELASFLKTRREVEDLTKTQTRQWHLYDFGRRLVLNIILFAIFSYIVYWTYHGRYTLGDMTLLLQLVQQARFPLFAMSFILGQIQEASAGSADYFRVLETSSRITDRPGSGKLVIPSPARIPEFISFDRVSFAYDAVRNVLSDISFTVRRGERFALVGESGQGKSTLVNLLLRYYEPQKGTIRIAGQDILTVSQESLHREIAVVFQESLLFSGTIMDNIRYGNPAASDSDVRRAARAANADGFITELTDGYKSLIGERGVRLSGGQKQRIAIARAILKNAPIIILDEATSSLDSKAELEVQKGLAALLKGRTAMIIAHRLSTIANADHILVLEHGKVAQYGNHRELVRDKKGLYAQLVSLQQTLMAAPTEERQKQLAAFDLVG
ncbi:ABC transporter ATP-binding protein/permease [Patescibacteria group bacterium]|nr:ABC transporter ATP-binding protein/permease [Patescibacteria group bacterium]